MLRSRILILAASVGLLSCQSGDPSGPVSKAEAHPRLATGPAPRPEPPAAPQPAAPPLPSSTLPANAAASDAGIPPGPRVYALSRNVWIRSAPQDDVQWIGSLWTGGSVKIRGPERVPGAGCKKDWVPIEPRGWVCIDEQRATLNPEHPALVRLYPDRARTDTPWPHQYAVTTRDVSRYRLPPELMPGKPGATELASRLPFPLLQGIPDLPPQLDEGRTKIVARSALAYVRELPFGEHTYLLMPDMTFVRRDRVELVPKSHFSGLRLEGDVQLPLAFFRRVERPRYRLSGDVFEVHGSPFERHSHVLLTGQEREVDGRKYALTKDGDWIDKKDAVIPHPKSTSPYGETPPAGRVTWIEASILEGWLVAFENGRPVYVTMISAGRGGTPVDGKDPVSTASTPTGRFPITGKFATATMESSTTPIVHGDVPWTQNFSGPHAIHSAYWHDDFGQLKSAGCVNVSPIDGRFLFEFTDPKVPDGWHAVKHVSRDGPATLVVLHE